MAGDLTKLLSVLLIFTPGAWLAFALLDASVAYTIRLALAIALSPFVIGVEVVTLTVMGMSFTGAAYAVLLNGLSLPSLMLRRPIPFARASPLVPVLCLSLLFGILVVLWALVPNLVLYGWHNMMQAAAAFQVTKLPKWPEEMDLAGFRLNYAWLGHVQVAVMSRLVDRSPLLVYPIVNFATLFAMFALLVNTIRRLYPGKLADAALAVTTGLLTANLIGILWSYLGGNVGDLRTSTPIHKFLYFDLMTVGMALIAGMICLLVLYSQRSTLRIWLMILACASATAVTYPLLFPAAFILGVAALLAPSATEALTGKAFQIGRTTVFRAISFSGSVVLFFGYLWLLSGGRSGILVNLRTPSLWSAAVWFKSTGAWLPLLAVAAQQAWYKRNAERLCLLVSAVFLSGLFILTGLAINVQYKFLVAALLCALPLAAEQWNLVLGRLGRAGRAIAVAVPAAALVIIAPHIWERLLPWNSLRAAVPLRGSSSRVEPVESANLQWVVAIRDMTPPETVIVTPALPLPIEIFAERSKYIVSDTKLKRAGYSMPSSVILDMKAYPKTVIDQRYDIVHQCNANNPHTDFAQLTRRLTSLDRPVALYLPSNNLYLDWLREHQRGHDIFQDVGGVVWLIDHDSKQDE